MRNRLKAELWDKLHYFLNESTDRMIRVQLWYNGQIDIDTMQKALRHLVQQHPVLHSSFCYRSLIPYWKINPLSIHEIFTLIESKKSDDNETTQKKEQFLMQIIPPESKTQLKIALIKSTQTTQLCLVINHMCTDGIGVINFLNQLSVCYSNAKLGISMPEIKYGSRSHHKIYSDISFAKKTASMFLLKNITHIKAKKTFAYTPKTSNDKALIQSITINENDLSNIQIKGKKMGVTLNNLLLSFYTHALYKTCSYSNNQSVTITCMANNRRHIKHPETIGLTNHVGLIQYKINVHDENILHTIKNVSETTRKEKTRFFGLKGIPLLWLGYLMPFGIAKRGTKAWFTNPVLALSNLGAIDEEHLKMGELNLKYGWFSTPVQYKPHLTLLAYKICHSLHLTIAFKGNKKDEETIQELFQNIKKSINKFISDDKTA